MAAKKGGKGKDGKKQRKKHVSTKIWNLFKIGGGKIEEKPKYCPKCGTGVILAKHKNRLSCGKCGYTEFLK